ncbi:ribonuclease H-like domain-containing protein [Aspergillus karnatakaensis]|uniref:putative RNA interference and gene silencing protein (Qde2) n=1 Tax=Aspergillus karnatakaensis TaxID=1810916 RepID=UPI003CCDFC90
MSRAGGPPQRGGRGRGTDRGRGPSDRGRGGGGRGRGGGDRGDHRGDSRGGGRGGDRGGASMDLPYRPAQGGNTGRGAFRGFGRGDRGGGGRGGGRGGFDHGPPIYSPPGGVPASSEKVATTESSLASALVKKKKSIIHPERPGYGTRGRPVQLFANYLELKSVGKALNRYHIDIDGGSARKPPGSKKAKQVIRLLLEEHFPEQRASIVTDYRSTMISHLKVLDQEQEPVTFDIRYKGELEDDYPEKQETYRVTCTYTGRLDPADLLNYLTSSNAAALFEAQADILQALNIAVGHHPKSATAIASVGANKHYAVRGGLEEKFNLGSGLEALRGYFVSVRAATARILVNVQVKYVACYQEGPLAQVINEFQRGSRPDINSLRKFLSKLSIRATHIERKNKKGQVIPRMKTIIDLATPHDGRSQPKPPIVSRIGAGPNDVQFFLDAPGQTQQASSAGSKKGKKPAKAGPAPTGSYITVAEFFRRTYNMQVDPKMPVVNVGNRKEPSYLPVEVCRVEPGQPAKAKLTANQTREMMKFAVRGPAQNAQSIVTKGIETIGLGNPANPTLLDFGIQANPSLITVPGRVLPAPSVYYKDSKSNQKQIAPLSGSWNMKSIRFSSSTTLKTWAWLLIDGGRQYFRSPDQLNGCLREFTKKLNEVGVVASPPISGQRVELNWQNYERDINSAISSLMEKHKPSLILTILPQNSTELYNCVKQACDIRYGVRNINVLAERLVEAKEQYFANVGLKFNLKLGGTNQIVNPKELGIIGEGKTMLVGIDVTHPSPGSAEGAPSVAGMVASINASLGQWPAEIRIQSKSRNEMVEDLDSMLKAHLRRWSANNKNKLPENIIVYRDGVSEGQYDLVTEKELPLLKAACRDTYPASDTAKNLPKFSIIIVGKRHHTRFFPTSQETADRSNNPVNGTVVDRGITEASNWDFFLQAHTALKGTARPAHYYTIWDEIFAKLKPTAPYQNTADILEALTHHMCYLFGRATKAVSICPPAYYADLVCTRARCYLSRAFDPITPSGSVLTGSGGGVNFESDDVRIHPNVKDTMFYI